MKEEYSLLSLRKILVRDTVSDHLTNASPSLKGLSSPLLHAYALDKEKTVLGTSSQPLESFPKHLWTGVRVPKKTVLGNSRYLFHRFTEVYSNLSTRGPQQHLQWLNHTSMVHGGIWVQKDKGTEVLSCDCHHCGI